MSFSDGRVLCYLIHHYHPHCVPLDAIRQRTSQTVECTQSGSVVLNSSSESDESCLDLSLKALELGQCQRSEGVARAGGARPARWQSRLIAVFSQQGKPPSCTGSSWKTRGGTSSW